MNIIIFCFVILIGFADPFPSGSHGDDNSVDEGDLIEGDIINLKTGSMRNLVRGQTELWPDKIFPYKFSADFTNLERFVVESAVADLASQTCVKFRERTTEPTYIVFKSWGKLCASVVGYTDLRDLGGEMPIYVSPSGCQLRGKIQHEILHSLGFWHEHSRPDRNEYITVNWDNIEPGMENNFEAKTWMDTQTLDLPYDLDSVMHYSKVAFSKNGKETLSPKVMRKDINMGQRFRFSKLDIAKLNRLYNCEDRYYKGNDILS